MVYLSPDLSQFADDFVPAKCEGSGKLGEQPFHDSDKFDIRIHAGSHDLEEGEH